MVPDKLLQTRHSLVRRLKDLQDHASWQGFFDTYWKLIYGVATKAGLTDAEAQDVVQETMLSVAKNIAGFQTGSEHGSFKGWLLQTTRWRIADQFRKRRPEGPRAVTADETARTSKTDRVPDPASVDWNAKWEKDWLQNLAAAALANVRARVDPEQYQMFDLHVLKGMPAQKAAQKLGVNIGKVYFATYKISRFLKKEVKRLEAKLV